MSSFIHEAIFQSVEQAPDPVTNASQFDTYADFPVSGNIDTIYLAKDTGSFYRWDGTSYIHLGGRLNAITFLQAEEPTMPLPRDLWLRIAEHNNAYTNNFGLGLFVRNDTNDAWLATASVKYYDNGNIAGFQTIGNDGVTAIESFNYDGSCRSTLIVGDAVQVWNGDLEVWSGDVYARGVMLADIYHNIFDQALNTTDSPIFSTLALSGFSDVAGFLNDVLSYLETFGDIVTHSASDFLTGNPFDQSLNMADPATFGSVTLPNGTKMVVGSFDNGTSGANGISLFCAAGYELNYQGGRLRNIVQGDASGNPITLFSDSPISAPSINFGGGNSLYDDSGLQWGFQSVAMVDWVEWWTNSQFDMLGAASSAQTNAETYTDGKIATVAPLFPLGSSYYAAGGTGANPAGYQVKDQSGTLIGYLNLSWDGSPLVLIGVQATDASGTPLVHGTFAMYYDGDGNLTSAVCTN